MRRHERLQRAARSRDRLPPAHKQLPGEQDFVAGILAIFRNQVADLQVDEKRLKATIVATEMAIQEMRASQPESLLLWREISAKQTEIKQLATQLDGIPVKLLGVRQPSEHVLRSQYASMRSIPRMRTITVSGGRIVLLTEPLFGRDHSGIWRRIGPFRASFCPLYPALSNLRWTNLDGPRGKYEGPPNISTFNDGMGSVTCPGDLAKRIITDAGRDRDYHALASFAIRYPECAGSITSKAIYGWPIVDPSEVPEWYLEQFGQ